MGPAVPPETVDLSAYLPACALRWLDRDPQERRRTVEGSVVFADVTGFTPLTERLARRGKVGAEELTDLLNEVFGALLEVAAAHEGDLLKFGGDALLLLFGGPQHARRACAAAAGMLDALRPWARLRTAGGPVRLAMSAGVASGACDLYLVGTSHRELLPVGTVFGEAVRMESLAPSGRVAVSPSSWRELEEDLLGPAVEDARLLQRPPVVERPATGRAAATPAGVAALGVPAGLRDHLRVRREWGEHRLATLTFLQFRGTESLRAEAGTEAVARALEALVDSVQESCERYGVTFLATDVDRDGGKVLLVAGAPTTTGADEDATLRAVRAVLDRPSLLSLRAGVNTGRVFAVDVGSRSRRTYAVMGDPTNLAARVMGRGSSGHLVATQDVLDRAQGSYALAPLEPFLVKGKTQPVSAQLVGQPRTGQRLHAEGRLLGRSHERAVLEGALASVRQGRSAVLEVVGDTGSGKSRLLAELLALAPDVPRLLVEPGPYDLRTPYRATALPVLRLLGLPTDAEDDVVAERLAQLVRAVAPELLPLLPLIGQPLGLELPATPESRAVDPAYRRARAHDACVALLAAGLPGPLLVLVDDAQWLDDASGDLLRAVLDRLEREPRLVVVARREEETGVRLPGDLPVPPQLLELGPLAPTEARLLIADVAGDAPLAAHVRDAVVARGAGNPLFLRELVASALRGGDLDDLPDTVEAMVTASVDVVPAAERQQLRTAAVLGPRFPAPLLAGLLARSPGARSGQTDVDEVVQRLSAFLARDGEEVRFLHGLVQEVAYEGLPFRLRRQLHGAAADLIVESLRDTDDTADLLALHYSRAGRHPEAWTWTRRAADRARRLGAPVEAAAHLRSALEAARAVRPPAPELAQVQEQLGETCELLGRFEEAADALRAARRSRQGETVPLAALACREGRLRTAAGRYAPALRWYTAGLKRLEGQPPGPEVLRVRGLLSVAYAGTRCDQGRWELALPHLSSAVEHASAVRDLSTLAQAHYLLDWARSELGDETAEEHLHEARRLYTELDDPVGLAKTSNNLGASAYFAGRWDEAVEHYQEHGRQSARAGDLVRTAVSAHNVAEVRSDQGRLDEAEPLFREALQTWRAADYRLGVALARSNLARLLVRRGATEEARPLLEQARNGFAEMGADAYVLEAEARDAERLVAARQPHAALEAVERTWSRCAEHGGGGGAALLALLSRLRGLAVAQTGDPAGAAALLASAVERSAATGAAYELALARLDQARLSRVRGRVDEEAETAAAAVLAALGVVAVPALPLDTA